MSSIMKGLVDETEAKKGADGKRCWKGKRYAGTENGKDKCIPVKNEAANPAQQAAIAINMKKHHKKPKNEGVIIGHDKDDPDVAVLGGAGSYKLSNLKKKALGEAKQLAQDIANGEYKNSAYNVKQLANTLNTIVAAEEEMEKLYFGEDETMQFAAEKTSETNPYGGQEDRQFRGAISETPTDNPTGASGEGGWRKYKPKSAGTFKEEQLGEGQYEMMLRNGQVKKFVAKDDADAKRIAAGHDAKSVIKLKGGVPAGKVTEEQLDEKCWDTHKQVGMKKKGDKMVPNCVPKESAIMKGLKR